MQSLWDSTKAVIREKFIAIQSIVETWKILNGHLNLTIKGTRKRRIKPTVSIRKEILKKQSRNKINEIKTKNRKINRTKTWFSENIKSLRKWFSQNR